MPSEKLLYHNKAKYEEYIHLLTYSLIIGISATFLYSPILGIITCIIILLNNVRTLIRNFLLREILLIILEFLNFEAFWIIMYDKLIPAIAVPLFVIYSTTYALIHMIYKMHSKKYIDILKNLGIFVFIFFIIIAAIFSIPIVFEKMIYFIFLILSSSLYFIILLLYAMKGLKKSKKHKIEHLFDGHDKAIIFMTIILFIFLIFSNYFNLPQISFPFLNSKIKLNYIFFILSEVDKLQNMLIFTILKYLQKRILL